MQKFRLDNKVAVITGGGSGIGKAISTTFAQQGGDVYVLDLDEVNAKETVQGIIKNGATGKAIVCDVTKQDEVEEIIRKINFKNEIDILVNNAGIAHIGNIELTSEEDLDRLYNVNIKGVYNCTQSCIRYMKKNGGVIINIASIASSVAVADRFAYSMTKGAVLAMTHSVAKDYLDYDIRCNSISPARIHTPFVDGFIKKNYPDSEKEIFQKLSKTQPIGRMGTPQEVADLALYLSSDEASFVTGTDFPIDGGYIKLSG